MLRLMARRSADGAATVRTFRAHSWIVRLAAAGITVVILSSAFISRGGHSSRAPWPLIAFLVALGLCIPVALLVWDAQRGVHIRPDGIRSVGPKGSRFVAWSEIDRFDIAPYVAGTIAVFADRSDGDPIALADTARWRYQRGAVEELRDELDGFRARWSS
jgi:hypothetical protein